MAESVFEKQQAALVKSTEETRKQMETAKEAAARAVDARAKVMQKQNEAFYEMQANLQPTPTQRENDLAKVGALDIDDKEDDGSEWDDEGQTRVAQEKLNNPYNVRVSEAHVAGRTRKARKK